MNHSSKTKTKQKSKDKYSSRFDEIVDMLTRSKNGNIFEQYKVLAVSFNVLNWHCIGFEGTDNDYRLNKTELNHLNKHKLVFQDKDQLMERCKQLYSEIETLIPSPKKNNELKLIAMAKMEDKVTTNSGIYFKRLNWVLVQIRCIMAHLSSNKNKNKNKNKHKNKNKNNNTNENENKHDNDEDSKNEDQDKQNNNNNNKNNNNNNASMFDKESFNLFNSVVEDSYIDLKKIDSLVDKLDELLPKYENNNGYNDIGELTLYQRYLLFTKNYQISLNNYRTVFDYILNDVQSMYREKLKTNVYGHDKKDSSSAS